MHPLARLLGLAALIALAPAGDPRAPGAAHAGSAQVTGLATYHDRAMLPPGAVLTVTLADISRAGAPAEVIARQTVTDLAGPPYPFALDFDPAAIDDRMTYAVSARVTLGDRLLMTSDTVHPVLTRGAGREAEVSMHRVSATAPADRTVFTAIGLRLPASFTGTLPAASGPGIAWHLDMWPDQVFHLRRDYGAGRAPLDEIGRWHADPARDLLVLDAGRESRIFVRPTGNGDLRVLSAGGQEIDSDLPDTLAAGPLDPTEIGTMPLTGMFRYLADAALFEICRTGRSFPVAMEGAYIDAERAYISRDGASDAPGEPAFMVLEGGIAERPPMEGAPRPHLVIDRFDRIVPGETCDPTMAPADLVDTFWRLATLMGAAVETDPDTREPFLVLRGGADPSFNASIGCNMMRGGYEADGDALSFGPAAATMMACPPPYDIAERALGKMLSAAASWRIDGQALEILDASGSTVATARAVYLP